MKKASILLFLLFLFLVLPFPSVFGDDWVSPTGFSDPDNEWYNEINAYDEDQATFAYNIKMYAGWGKYLHLTVDPIQCSKIRFDSASVNKIEVDVKKDGVWETVFSGFPMGGWNTEEFEQGEVTELRVRAYSNPFSQSKFDEADFWEIEEAPPTQYELNLNSLPFQNVNFTLNGTTYQTNYTDTLNESYYNITFPSTWLNNSISYVFKNWSDGLTNPSRIINLNENMTLTVTYVLPAKIPVLFVGACVIGGLICFVFILAWKRKKR